MKIPPILYLFNANLGGWGILTDPNPLPHPYWFSLTNTETVKAVPSLQIFGKTQTRVFSILGFLVNPL